MIVTLTSTTKVVTIDTRDGASVPARVWEGVTAGGIPVIAFITRIAVEHDQDATEFEADLREHPPPANPDVAAWPARMLID